MLQLSYFLLFAVINSIVAETINCDKLGILVYEDLGCTPTYKPSNNCPSKYICKGLEESQNQCYFHGKSYSDGAVIDDDLVGSSCNFGCFCHKNRESKMTINCAQGQCGEYSGQPPTPGCYRKYSLDYCCSTGEICPQLPNNITICKVDGKEYKEGEKFFPEYSCTVCLCQKGFSGKYVEPFCRRRACGVQLRNQKEVSKACAPLFLNEPQEKLRCCPRTWVCPEANEEVIKGNYSGDETCKFGEKTLKIGDSFQKDFERTKKIRCDCLIPPLLTCHEDK